MSKNGQAEPLRAQVGIGTLIVFIALVLVASISAGVLLTTGDSLQTSSQETGKDTTSAVSDRVSVIGTSGTVTEAKDRIVLDSSPLNDAEKENGRAEEQFIIRSGDEVEAQIQGGDSDCSPPFDLIIDGTRSDNPVTISDDRLKITKTADEKLRIRHLDDDNPNYVITTASPELSARIDDPDSTGCDGHLTFIETNDFEKGWKVDESGTAELRFAKDSVTEARITVQRSPGADTIDLRSAVVRYLNSDTYQHLTYGSSGASETTFGTEALSGDDIILQEDSDRVTIILDTRALAPGLGLRPDEEAVVDIGTAQGSQTRLQLTVPSSLSRQAVDL